MIKKELLRFTLSAIIAYLTGFTLNLAIATSQLSGGNGTHFCGVIDGQLNKQHSDQFPNRRYARTFAANLNAGEPYTVQLIYFLPSDRQPRPNIDIELDRRIKETQQYYADVMEYHGFGRKTFRFETDATGKAVIHHVRGRFNDAYYQNPSVGSRIVWNEIDAQFDTSRNIYLLVLDISSEYLDGTGDDTGGVVGRGSGDSLSGKALVPTSYIGAALHELGHAFGLMHDTRFDAKVSSGGYGDPMTESFCSAEWLDVHRYFNTSQNAFNEDTSVQMLTSSLAAPPDSIRLRFEVADPDGLHQAQLFKPFGDDSSVIDCKQLNGKRMTIEFVTTRLIGSNDIVLRVIDVHGNFKEHRFPIDITPLLSPPEAISIPDPNLAAVVRETLGMAPSDAITQLAMLNLGNFNAVGRQIINLTGIEIATNIYQLRLEDNQIRDITLLAGLTKLNRLYISGNPIGDISPLVGLTNLQDLRLSASQISDITPLARLTKLVFLHLWSNRISDLSPVAGLTNLRQLHLKNNSISDLSSLVANTGLGDRDRVYVQGNPLSYLSIHTHIPTLQSRGVTVEFDNRTPRPPLKVSGDDQWGIPDAALEHPFIVEVRDQKGEVFAGVPVTFVATTGSGTLSTTRTTTDANGMAQSILTLGPNTETNTISVSAVGIQETAIFHAVSDTEAPPIIADVNGDGSVNILDLILVASELGNTGTNLVVDVNRDGVVSILDLILVAGMFGGAAAAPAAQPQVPETLTAVEVQQWLTDARALEVRNSIMKRGFLVLEQLLVSLIPTETQLLANYPNPFNPETWIPYRLAEDAFVTLTIYDLNGQVVRTLDVGHRTAAFYESRSKAIYWNGRNEFGEGVASGVYFYHLSAGDFSATRKMLILK